MDKMTIYESARVVPKEAQKAIGGGRLKGMTDINPMWRVKKLTELFGPAGIGWRFDPPVFEEKPGVNGEIMVHCCTKLYIRQIDEGGEKNEWSAPIPGVGGSMLIATEKDGKRTDDEAYKKAYTDAQSVACKALGISADVYWEKDPTKYDRPTAPSPAKPTAPSPAKPTAPSPAKPTCASCGKPVAGFTYKGEKVTAQQAADRSKKKYGRILCMECAKKQPKEDGRLTHA